MDRPAPPDPLAERFVHELVGTGMCIADTLGGLVDSLEESDPWPGEDPAQVVLDMAVGSIAIALRDASDRDVERAIELMSAARERFIADLQLAAEVAGRRERMRR